MVVMYASSEGREVMGVERGRGRRSSREKMGGWGAAFRGAWDAGVAGLDNVVLARNGPLEVVDALDELSSDLRGLGAALAS